MEMNTIEELKERVILIGVSVSDGDDTEESLKELKELADTAGAETVGTVIQKREAVHPGTYIGKGKIEEVRAMAFGLNATGVICDDELSPAQLNNLEQELDLKVMDRTLIILDIFAAHARTSEGKIQVELAQLKYRQARLVGLRNSLSRLGGGIGTRGPGEKKLEMDRRLIKSRIAQLNRELEEVKRHREITRAQRSRNRMPVAAIVGLYQCGKIHASEPVDRSRRAGRRQAFCHAGSDHPYHYAGKRHQDPHHRHGRLYPQASPSSGGGF